MSFGVGCSNSSEEASSEVATVTFDLADASISSIPVKKIKKGETIVVLLDPKKADFEFAGWYTDSKYLDLYKFTTPVTKDITLYAKWISRSEYNQLQASSGFTLAQDGTSYSVQRKARISIIGELTIPERWNGKHITAISSDAFVICTSLTSVTVNRSIPPSLGSSVFSNCPDNLQIKVPQAAVGAYQSAPGWSEYRNKISLID